MHRDDVDDNEIMMLLLCKTDAESGQCVSTGNADDIQKPENERLLKFLTDGRFMPGGIQLPAGELVAL